MIFFLHFQRVQRTGLNEVITPNQYADKVCIKSNNAHKYKGFVEKQGKQNARR